MLNNIDKIYVCHYTKLTDRKIILQETLNKLGLDVEWVEVYDKEVMDLSNYPLYKQVFNINNNCIRKLKDSEISLILKHNYIWEDMIKNNYQNVLVLEDDVMFVDNFINLFNCYTKELPMDYDLLWVGSCCGIHAKMIEDKHIYKSKGSRCTHAYMINQKCAIKMIMEHKNINLPVDFMFNQVIEKYNLDNYWLEPSLINQNKKFNSSIQNL